MGHVMSRTHNKMPVHVGISTQPHPTCIEQLKFSHEDCGVHRADVKINSEIGIFVMMGLQLWGQNWSVEAGFGLGSFVDCYANACRAILVR